MTLPISIIICVKNEVNSIKNTIESVLNIDVDEIIVVDGNSTDGTLDIIKTYNITLYSVGDKGLGCSRQLGCMNSHSDYVCYIDSDTIVPNPNTLSIMLNELKSNNWIAIQAQMYDPRENKTLWELGEFFEWQNNYNIPGEKKFLGTNVCIFNREILLKYGFDIDIKGAGEDADIFFRLKKDGYKFGRSNEKVYYYFKSNLKEFLKQRFWYGKGNGQFIIKHGSISLLITPFGIMLRGMMNSIKFEKPVLMMYYITWGVSLWFGTLFGIVNKN